MRFVPGVCLCLGLVGCASWQAQDEAEPLLAVDPVVQTPWAKASLPQLDAKPWQHMPLPGKRATEFKPAFVDGRQAMAVTAVSSASMLRKQVHVKPDDLGQLRFSWMVPALMAGSDMALRDADDAPVRVVLAFDGDRSKFSSKNAMLSEMARMLTGEDMPYATLMYVWCNERQAGSVIHNPRTDRIRKLVVESGADRLGQWVDYQQDIRADFVRAYGEKPGALIAVGIMTDSDNTRSTTQAWYGPLRMLPASMRTP
ncbi:hypothetical protein ASF43_05200 [Pseudorhodoferax sp. Leaf267]|nr:hypothetical protein ASF43_05200 [Pseudorhodoferax sp. Leaf267]